ncbi:MAG: hypothetical protein R6V03_06605 [Kiritimatiellia bacterium]
MNAATYPVPNGIACSDHFAVRVDEQDSFTYQTTGPAASGLVAGQTASWTSFDLRGPCRVRIRRLDRPVSEVVVRPVAKGIEARIAGDEIVVEFDQPAKLSVECDGDTEHVLFLFGNAPESDVPDRNDPAVVWFGPGVHEVGRAYRLAPETTYYLAPGAFVKGTFAGGGDGTRICGRGVLSGRAYKWPGHQQERSPERIDLVRLKGNEIEISGATFVDAPFYVLVTQGRRCRYTDVKVIAWYFNTDGISSGSGARIDDCFLRVSDDVFKPFVSDTHITRCTLWCDKGAPFMLSWNAMQDYGGSVVRDCDVIHHQPHNTGILNEWTPSVFRAWHGGVGHIYDLRFEDIRIEGPLARFIDVRMKRNPWSIQEGEWGRFRGLTFRNIVAEGPVRWPSRLLGHDADHRIDDVSFENLRIGGRRIAAAADLDLETNEFVRGLRFV